MGSEFKTEYTGGISLGSSLCFYFSPVLSVEKMGSPPTSLPNLE